MSRTSSGRKKFEGRMRKLEREEERKKEEQKKLDAIEDAKWRIGAKSTEKDDAAMEKKLQAEALKRERDLAYEEECKRDDK